MTLPYNDVSTNNDDSCFCCCHSKGVSIYDSYPVQMRLDLNFDDTGINKCFLLNRTNYIAMVRNNIRVRGDGIKNESNKETNDDPLFPILNQVFVWDDLLKKIIFKLNFLYPIDKIFLTRLYLIVVSFKEIKIFTFTNPPRKLYDSHTLKTDDTYTNGNIDFKLIKSIGVLAYESINRLGQIYISRLDYDNVTTCSDSNYIPTNIIKAHKNPIQLMRLSPHGKYVATCSIKGTIIRVFNTVNGLLINEYRRGLDSATIYNMKFSQDNRFLCVVSNKQTLHIFQVMDEEWNQRGQNLKNRRIYNRSVCSIKLFNPLIRNSEELFQSTDKCEIIWNVYDNDVKERDNIKYGIILVWYRYRIWIRYIITYNDISSKSLEIIRESWRQL